MLICWHLLQMLGHVLTFAFLMVIASTALMTPILLYVFDLRHTGWMWQHAALFSAMIAPTDAVSVSSVLKKGVLGPTCSQCCVW
jgi:NhaP-type Na+/H+ or K+/H+ antiporter